MEDNKPFDLVSFSAADSLTLPAGDYIMTDPCYFLKHRWDELCEKIFCAHGRSHSGVMAVSAGGVEYKILWSDTNFGDGRYDMRGYYGGTVCVDAGMICVMPRALAEYFFDLRDYIERGIIAQLSLSDESKISVDSDCDWSINNSPVLCTCGCMDYADDDDDYDYDEDDYDEDNDDEDNDDEEDDE